MVWTEVTSSDQLWRFQTGHVSGTRSLNPGEDYVVFRTKHRGWLRADNKALLNHHGLEGQQDKFRIQFLPEGTGVAIGTANGKYWSTQAGNRVTCAAEEVGPNEKFRLYIDKEEEHVVVKSCEGGHWVTAMPDGRIQADHDTIPTREGWEMLRGWKRGTREDWRPVEGMPFMRQVSSPEQLWRFHTGHQDGKTGLTPQGEMSAFVTPRRKWLSLNTESGSLSHDRNRVDATEKFQVRVIEDGHVTIKCANGKYLTAGDDGSLSANGEEEGDAQKFKAVTDAQYENVAFQTTQGKWIDTLPSGAVKADIDTLEKSGLFRGWKKGSREDWEVKDTWEVVGYLDNRARGESAELNYQKTVGTTKEDLDSFLAIPNVPLEVDPDFVNSFVTTLSAKSTIGFNWSTCGSDVWQPGIHGNGTWSVAPGQCVTLCQAKGTCGPVIVRPDHFVPKV